MQLAQDRRYFRVAFGDVGVDITWWQAGGKTAINSIHPDRGEVLNLSAGGMLFSCQREFQIRSRIVVRLQFCLDNERFALDAQVLRKTDTITAYEYGCSFIELLERDEIRLVRILNTLELARRKGVASGRATGGTGGAPMRGTTMTAGH